MKFNNVLRCVRDVLEQIAMSFVFLLVAIYAALLFCICKIFGISLEDDF